MTAHFGDYNPADFGWAARDPRNDPSMLAPFTFNGVTYGSMHVDVHGLFRALFTELVPHIPGGLVAGQCGCYNAGSVTVGGSRSFHTYGIATDTNWGANPMNAWPRPTGPHTLPANTGAIVRKYGCEWGGDWTSPHDWMHIEVHLSPAEARAYNGNAPIHPPTPQQGASDMATVFTNASKTALKLLDTGSVVMILKDNGSGGGAPVVQLADADYAALRAKAVNGP